MEWLSNSSLTSLPALNVFGVRDPLQGLVRGYDSRGVLVASAPAARIHPLCHIILCFSRATRLHRQFCQVVFVLKLSLEIAELTWEGDSNPAVCASSGMPSCAGSACPPVPVL